jgi:hypothetical protein
MDSVRNSRLRGPAVMIIAGAVVVGAVVAGYGWQPAIAIAIIAVAAAIRSYAVSGRDSDRGALARGQMDERQRLLRWQAWSFSARAVFAATAVGALVAAVLRGPVWPFSLFMVYQVIAFYAGLAFHRARATR